MEDLKLDLSKYSILVEDDVPLNVMLGEKMLSRFGFRILKAENGLEAMREILADKPDLVFLDIMMPIMDGFQTLEQIRKNPELSDLRVVVLSALNSNEDIVKAYNLGANDFITKPIMLDKLINNVITTVGDQIPLVNENNVAIVRNIKDKTIGELAGQLVEHTTRTFREQVYDYENMVAGIR